MNISAVLEDYNWSINQSVRTKVRLSGLSQGCLDVYKAFKTITRLSEPLD